MGTSANEYVQSRKGPLIDGRYVDAGKKSHKRKEEDTSKLRDNTEHDKINSDNTGFKKNREKFDKSKVCFNCQEKGTLRMSAA